MAGSETNPCGLEGRPVGITKLASTQDTTEVEIAESYTCKLSTCPKGELLNTGFVVKTKVALPTPDTTLLKYGGASDIVNYHTAQRRATCPLSRQLSR